MNEFAKLLSAFVKEKGVKIQPFARYCGYDRANMYKILKGQRNLPGREIVEKAAKYMHLLPSEEEKLCLMLEETGLLFSFFDFCENLSTEQIFSSSEEIESFLKDLLTK